MHHPQMIDPKAKDLQLRSQIEGALAVSDHAWSLRSVLVEVVAGCVVLSGRLPSYYLKQVAQSDVMKVDGVAQVRNEIRVIG